MAWLIKKKKSSDKTILNKKVDLDCKTVALAGNPNVGKSTIFNALTGLKQHTGNWPGKTVSLAKGDYTHNGKEYTIVDLPGTYSLMAHSAEEEVARDFLIFKNPDAAIIVCDASCIQRSIIIALQSIEISSKVLVCINLMDEAEKRGIKINLDILEKELGVFVVGTKARHGFGLEELMQRVSQTVSDDNKNSPRKIRYPKAIEAAIEEIIPALKKPLGNTHINLHWLALRLLEEDSSASDGIKEYFGIDLYADINIKNSVTAGQLILQQAGLLGSKLQDAIASCFVLAADEVCCEGIEYTDSKVETRQRKLDKILTSKLTGIPIMLVLLGCVLWLTISGANYPSKLIGEGLFWIEDRLLELFVFVKIPSLVTNMLVMGVYHVVAWVVSVMLPPMAIFFPLFTLLEDFGYLPRIAFNLDHQFSKAKACGKQALTMCMGFGCNAAGVVGCRIIDSPRERLIAILTNNFVPCNGRFPTLIAIISMFFVGGVAGVFGSLLSSMILTCVILLGIILTFIVSRLLSATLLKGQPSSFTLELPPYRTPQVLKVIVRSFRDRTLFVLGRAVAVAAPAGLIIWIMANVFIGDSSILAHCSAFLDPFARLLGLDGIILIAFILGFPANEIVVPIIIMAYMSTGSLADMSNLAELKGLFVSNGWTWVTAVSTMLFCLIHWPCSTTCLSIKKETGSFYWTILAIAIPTVSGVLICFLFNVAVKTFGLFV